MAPFDMNKITNIGNVNPGMVAVGERDWNFGGKGSHWVPCHGVQSQFHGVLTNGPLMDFLALEILGT